MQQRAIPILAPVTKPRHHEDGYRETKARGLAVLNSPLLNKGTAFTAEERAVKRASIQYEGPRIDPADPIAWTDGRALTATGGPFGPVTHKGVTYVVGQLNNAMLYPGLCLGAIVSRASRLSEGMFASAAGAAVTVAETAVAEGQSEIRRHRSAGARHDVSARVSPDSGILRR